MPAPRLFADPVFLEHQTGDHPESPERLRHLAAWLAGRQTGAWPGEEGFAASWRREQRFEPAMDEATRARGKPVAAQPRVGFADHRTMCPACSCARTPPTKLFIS